MRQIPSLQHSVRPPCISDISGYNVLQEQSPGDVETHYRTDTVDGHRSEKQQSISQSLMWRSTAPSVGANR